LHQCGETWLKAKFNAVGARAWHPVVYLSVAVGPELLFDRDIRRVLVTFSKSIRRFEEFKYRKQRFPKGA